MISTASLWFTTPQHTRELTSQRSKAECESEESLSGARSVRWKEGKTRVLAREGYAPYWHFSLFYLPGC